MQKNQNLSKEMLISCQLLVSSQSHIHAIFVYVKGIGSCVHAEKHVSREDNSKVTCNFFHVYCQPAIHRAIL